MPGINLLPPKSKKDKAILRRRGVVLLLAVGLVELVAIFTFYSSQTKDIAAVQQKKQSLQKEVTLLEKELEETAAEASITTPEAEEKRAEPVARERDIVSTQELIALLEELGNKLPEGTWLSKLDKSNGICALEGYAFSKHEVSELLKTAKSLSGVTKAALVETERELVPTRKIPLHHFKVELTLEGAS